MNCVSQKWLCRLLKQKQFQWQHLSQLLWELVGFLSIGIKTGIPIQNILLKEWSTVPRQWTPPFFRDSVENEKPIWEYLRYLIVEIWIGSNNVLVGLFLSQQILSFPFRSWCLCRQNSTKCVAIVALRGLSCLLKANDTLWCCVSLCSYISRFSYSSTDSGRTRSRLFANFSYCRMSSISCFTGGRSKATTRRQRSCRSI